MPEPNVEVLAITAYEAFRTGSAIRDALPRWGDLPPEAREDWRAVADAVRMTLDLKQAAVTERIAALAHEYRAVYFTGNAADGLEKHYFADLIRQETGNV